MADLFDPPSPPPPPPPPQNFPFESDDISSLLHTLLHNSSGSAPFSHQPASPLDPNFRFAGGFYSSGANDRAENGLSMEGIGDVDCESEEQEEMTMNQRQARGSSKRSRAAEVHNLSEKRRRQKINEKMKALQKLIPNSNKTDKASMLDEAIEYLKQLQLQVQMLTLRNSSGLHPFYLPGVSHPVQPPQVGPLLDEPNGGRGGGSFPGNEEASVQTMFDHSVKPNSFDHKHLMPRMSDNSNSGLPFAMEPSTNTYYRSFNASMTSKALYKDPVLPHLQLEMSQGQSTSSGVSS